MLPLHPALITGVGSFRGPSSCRDNCFPSASSPSPSPTPTLSKPNLDRGSCISKREESLGSFFIPSPEFCYPPPPPGRKAQPQPGEPGWSGDWRTGQGWGFSDRGVAVGKVRNRGGSNRRPPEPWECPSLPRQLSSQQRLPRLPPTPGPPFSSGLLHSSLLHSGSRALRWAIQKGVRHEFLL